MSCTCGCGCCQAPNIIPPEKLDEAKSRPKFWWAYFSDYKDLKFGYIQSEMVNGVSGNTAEIQVVEKSKYDHAVMILEGLVEQIRLADENMSVQDLNNDNIREKFTGVREAVLKARKFLETK